MPVKRYQKIAFVAGTLGTGGAERQLYYLATSLIRHGYQISVYCLTQGEFYESKLENAGIRVKYFGNKKSRSLRAYRLYRLLKKDKPLLLYSFHFYTNTYAGIAAKMLGIRVIGSVRSNAIAEKKSSGRLSWLNYMLPDNIIVNSRHAAENCRKIFYKKSLFVLDNVIETNLFQYALKKIDKETLINVLWVGRFAKVKQPLLFPEVIKNLADRGLKVQGSMYGDGAMKNELITLINSQYKNYSITLYPVHSQIQDVYRNAHWLCSLSKYEGSPNVVFEAMSSGVAVAALNYQGIRTLVINGVDGLVQESLDQLCDGIVEYSGQELYNDLTRQARKKIEQHYSIEVLVTNFENILCQI